MSKTQPARGMRDFLPADIRKRNYVINIIKEVYESYGFEPLETPAVENLETLTGKYGEEGTQLMFKILKRGEKLDISGGEKGLSDLALRYDLTVPLARVVANYKNELPRFFKRYQIQPVWRADRPARGRYREFYQCDVDAIGSNSMMVEAELCAAVCEILMQLEFDDFVIKLNHRGLLDELMVQTGIIERNQRDKVLSIIDKWDKIGDDGVANELNEQELEEFQTESLLSIFEGFKSNDREQKLNWLELNFPNSLAVSNLRLLLEFLRSTNASSKVEIDLSLARGLSYYTGTIMEIVLNKGDFSGSIAGGGRYDGLIGMFGKEAIPACGLSIGLERILFVMEERGIFDKLIAEGKLKDDSADILVTVWDEKTVGESLKLANELRSVGLRVLVYAEADKLGKQFKYADSIGVKTAIIMRDEEIAENTVKVKNLQTGDENTFSREEIAEKLSK